MSEPMYADCCSRAKAVVVFVKDQDMLALCGHHRMQHGPKMLLEGWGELDASVDTDTVMKDVEALWGDHQWNF